jgi:hypothetical protein
LQKQQQNDTPNLDKSDDDDDLDSAIVSKQQNYKNTGDAAHISQSDSKSSNRRAIYKRKANQLGESSNVYKGNNL